MLFACVSSIQASEGKQYEKDENGVVTIYSDFKDQAVIDKEVKEIFEKDSTVKEVSVKDINKMITSRVADEGWRTVRDQHYFDASNGVSAELSCYVVQTSRPSVSSCSASVTIYGPLVARGEKTIRNNNTLDAYLYYSVTLKGTWGGTLVPGLRSYTLDLF